MVFAGFFQQIFKQFCQQLDSSVKKLDLSMNFLILSVNKKDSSIRELDLSEKLDFSIKN